MKRTINMTEGSPAKNILLFSIPVLLGTLFQQMYNMADTVIVGRFLGEDALAAVGSTGSTVYMVIGFTAGLSQGFSILIAQAFGARRQDDLKMLVAHALFLTVAISLLFTVPTVLLCRNILIGMNTPEEILHYAHSYLQINFCGILCTMAYNVAAGILRAMGDSKTPLFFLILSSFLNIGLDVFFIVVSELGTAGVALATIVSQGISAILCYGYMMRQYPFLRLCRSDFRLKPQQIARMLRTGIPMAMNQSVIALGIMIMQSGVNTFGASVMAAYAAASKVENLTSQPMTALGSGISVFCGQNFGAQRFDRIQKGVRQGLMMSFLTGCLGMILYFVAAEPIIHLFIADPSEELLLYAKQYLFTAVWFLPALAWIFLLRSALVGLGNGSLTLLSGLLELACRFLCVRFLLPFAGFWCVRLTNPITWVATCALFICLYIRWERTQIPREGEVSLNERT